VRGRRVACFTTAPGPQYEVLRRHLEERWECRVEVFSGHLADRVALRKDLQSEAMSRVDTVLTEVKAAAIDVVVEEAEARGLPVVFMDNIPVEVEPGRGTDQGGSVLQDLAQGLAAKAVERFKERMD
jgi:cyclic 2,3-diphosphoglycerate synthetase